MLPRFKTLASSEVHQKTGPNDLVTEADLHCQAILTETLGELLPKAAVVGEEGGGTEAEACAAIASAEWCWVIDPLDGTHNFAHSRTGFVVMVALVHRGETVGAWIYDPLAERSYTGVRGAGAWSGGQRLGVAKPGPLKQMTGVLYVGQRRAPALHARLKRLERDLGPTSFLRSAGSEYLGLASGSIHYAIFTRLLPWDHAPGVLLHREAGGYAAYWDGQPYRPDAARPIPLLLAPDEESWRGLHAAFGGAASLPA